jgi:glycosyltransferase involved in cell wall biosynthesis
MKILHVIRSCDPRGGGPIEALKRLAAEVVTHGHAIDVVCLDAPASGADDGPFNRVIRLGRGMGKYGLSMQLLGWLRLHVAAYDVVVVNGLWQFHSAAAYLVLRKTGGRYFVFAHGMLDPWFRKAYPLKHIKKLCYWLLMERHVVNRADGLIFTSESERVSARQSFPLYQPKERVTAYGTANPPLDVDGGSRAADKKVILFLGRLHEKKGCDLLIEAFAQLGPARSDYHLVIAGPADDAYLKTLRKQARELGVDEEISWPGLVTGADKWRLLRSAEVFCLPSHQENFGVAVAEALACGTPVIISNKVNIWEEVEADGAGLVCEDTAAGTHASLRRWISLSRQQRLEMGAAARECFDRRFHISRAARSYLSILASARESQEHVA